MSENNASFNLDVFEGPHSKLEISYIEEYLKTKGYLWADLCLLLEDEAKKIMTEACRYATIKLADHEARAKFRRDIHID